MPWYEALFEAPPTRRPMDGLAEWHITDSAEVQLYQSPEKAGKSTLTIRVTALDAEHERLSARGLAPQPIESATNFFLMRLSDPDGNLVVLVSTER